ncbi:MAG: exodeoxyribonuclease VII small subunit [Candidatus Melainabacteria bacterium]
MSKAAKAEPTFTESSEALDAIIDQFKGGSLPLEEALTLFESGVGHLNNCQAKLNQAQGKVEELVKTLQLDGEIVTQLFE